jgi:Rps23 Pro-64 3,4-dihydroxylase Tpa1-like proline 4-hydroxylase
MQGTNNLDFMKYFLLKYITAALEKDFEMQLLVMHKQEDIDTMREILLFICRLKTMISRDLTTLKDKRLFDPLIKDFYSDPFYDAKVMKERGRSHFDDQDLELSIQKLDQLDYQ